MTKKPKPNEPKTLTVNPRNSLGGSKCESWNTVIAHQIMNTLWLKNSDAKERDRQIQAVLGALIGIDPKDELEGQIVAQMLAAHHAAMECYRRAMIGEQTFEGRSQNLSQANKLSRTHVTLVEALNRHRGKGQQKVTVEHVNVHAGGQAIVGNVADRGGGSPPKPEDQPHALAYAPGATLQGAIEAERDAVPIASRARS